MSVRLIACLLALLIVSPAHAAERSFLVGSFEDVIVEGDIIVDLQTGLAPSAKASGDKDRLGSLKIDRQGTIVRIRLQGIGANRASTEPLRVALTGRNVKKLVVQGNGKISVNGLDMQQTRLEIRGSGEIDVARIKSERLVALLIGAGKLTVAGGTVRDGDVTIDGSPTLVLSGTAMQKLRLNQNGPANSHFQVNDSAEITNSGTGKITIDGTATCFVRKAGGASIDCKKMGK
jgi:Putative auto-transporter adhesin, head GIN domain